MSIVFGDCEVNYTSIISGVSTDIVSFDATQYCCNVRTRQAPAHISYVLSWRVVYEDSCKLFACITQRFLPSAHSVQGNVQSCPARQLQYQCFCHVTTFFFSFLPSSLLFIFLLPPSFLLSLSRL